jgi:hypothetical protein
MALALFLALQAAEASAPPAILPITFDLARHQPADAEPVGWRDCSPADASDPSEIVVCGRRRAGSEDYPYEEMERRYRQKPIMAEIGIGGGATARAYVDSVEMSGGQTSKRVMVGIKLPF